MIDLQMEEVSSKVEMAVGRHGQYALLTHHPHLGSEYIHCDI